MSTGTRIYYIACFFIAISGIVFGIAASDAFESSDSCTYDEWVMDLKTDYSDFGSYNEWKNALGRAVRHHVENC